MKQTRKIVISDRAFTAEDLRRIAKRFEKNKALARKSDHHSSTQYEVTFSNHTSLETDLPEVFADESLAGPGRPEAIRMSFWNYPMERHIKISLSHGDALYDNLAVITSNESTWVSENFLALKDAVDKVQPQTVWITRHKTLLLNLIALGIGCLVDLITGFVADHLRQLFSAVIKPLSPDSPWGQVISSAAPILYILKWIWRWALGFLWGAFGIRRWLLSLWPTVEFRFGLAHLQTEQLKRRRLLLVATLVILPILTSLAAGLIQATRHD